MRPLGPFARVFACLPLLAGAAWAQAPAEESTDEPARSTPPEPPPSNDEAPREPTEGPADGTPDSARADPVPPRILEARPAPLPEGARPGQPVRVVLQVTLDAAGAVVATEVRESPGAAYSAAAQEAVRGWRFAPATENGRAIPATVPVEVPFAEPAEAGSPPPPDGPPPDGDVAQSTSPPPPTGAPATPDPGEADSTESPPEPEYSARGVAEAELSRARARGAADFAVRREVLTAAPHRDAAEMLRTVPGVYVARQEGFAVAPRITLRGFDADHGQDIEMLVDGVPINQPSHIHGQGYADMGFLLPEVIREIRATEGVYDPRQGDFATAGTFDFTLGVEERGVHAATTYGSFDTFRQVLVYAPEDDRPDTFGAAAYRKTSGFGAHRGGQDASAILQQGFGEGATRVRLTAMLSGARYDHAGVLRREDVAAGRVGFYDVYPFATARAQNALNARAQLSVAVEQRGDQGQVTEALLWTTYHDFRIQENFTGFLRRSTVNPDWYGRGDLVAQENDQLSFGARARHRTAAYRPLDGVAGTLEVGLATRLDLIDQKQTLVQAPQNQTWDRHVDSSITGADVGTWLDLDLALGDRVHLRGGVRADALFYEIDDRLGNFIPAFRQDQYILGFRRSAMGVSVGPRVSSEVILLPWLTGVAAYGEGYRSPQARALVDGESAPFTKVRSADLGARARLLPEERLELSASGFWTDVSEDIAFDPGEGRLEPIGPTTRLGVVARALLRPNEWLLASASITAVRATLDAPPRATAANPSPAYEHGAALPFVAPVTARLDLAARPELVTWGGAAVRGRAGLGYSYLSPRPLPFGQRAEAVSLVDAVVGARWRELELSLEVQNLFDAAYAATELNFVSHWDPEAVPSRLPARHMAAGAPRTFLVTLGLHL